MERAEKWDKQMAQNWKDKILGPGDAELAVARTIVPDYQHSKLSERTVLQIGRDAIRQGYKPSWSESEGWVVLLPLGIQGTEGRIS
jgi:hypothetical protein